VANRQPQQAAEEKRRRAIEMAASGRYSHIIDLLDDLGTTRGAFDRWRDRNPQFAVKFNTAFHKAKDPTNYEGYDGTFLSFRQVFLGMKTTKFQAKIVRAIEEARPGEVTLILIPPAHGKTTLLEDYCTWKLVEDPSFKITVASETVDHGMKVVGRVRDRFEDDGPNPQIPQRFGPIAPEGGQDHAGQVWGAKRFNVAKKLSLSGERDYSMSCVGLTGRVQGTRCDLLLLDDMQDVKSLELSSKYYTIVTQSFLSRPEMFGRTVIIGTRVGALDVYALLMKNQVPDKTIAIAAYDTREAAGPYWPAPSRKPVLEDESTWAPKGVQFLWPEKYDDPTGFPPGIKDLHRFRYAKLRFTLGEKTWWRIYMQRPEEGDQFTFDRKTTGQMYDEHRSIYAEPRPIHTDDGNHPVPVVIALDPSLGGGNGVLAAACYPEKLEVLHVKLDFDLTKYSQIINQVEEECRAWSTGTSFISCLVVESVAFQKGIMNDERLEEVQRHFGFRIIPHVAFREKADPDIGIRGMPFSMMREEITIPWSDDMSRENMMLLLDQLHMWQPGTKGAARSRANHHGSSNDVPQDLVMCLWFAWRYWRNTSKELVSWAPPVNTGADFQATGSPLRRRRRPTARRARVPYGVR
jgi:hypothetical protein